MSTQTAALTPKLAKQLIAEQFPQWSHCSLSQVQSAGTDNAMFRMGDSLVLRLPFPGSLLERVSKEQKWLPWLAPHLPLAIPELVARGVPSETYPCAWSIYRWMEGTDALTSPIKDKYCAAQKLAEFIRVLHKLDASQGPPAGAHNFYRGAPLQERDTQVRKALTELEGLIDTRAAIALWEASLKAPVWHKKPVWIHGDIHAGNLLTQQGHICA